MDELIVHRLSNGLRVVLRPHRVLPLLTLDMWVRVGSADEPRTHAGISHYLEHMLFKGTQRLATGEYDRRIEGLGGYLNAGTSTDYTHYYIEVPSHSLEPALRDFGDVLSNSILHHDEVEGERQVILEEIRRKNDDPTGFLYDRLVRNAYLDGAYSHPVIGYEDTVSAFDRATLLDHYRRFYTADNMTLAISGDFDPDAILPLLEGAFADLPHHRRPWRDAAPPTTYAPPATHFFPRDWNETYFYLAFPAPPCASLADCVRTDLADTILTGGRVSRLVNALREKLRIVTSISAYTPSSRHDALMIISGRCAAGNLQPACDAIHAEIDTLLAQGLRPGEEQRLRRQLLNSHVFLCESNSDVTGLIGWSEVLLGNQLLYTDYKDAVAAARMDDVLKGIRDTIAPERASLFVTARAQESP